MTHGSMKVANHFNQNSIAEAQAIKRLVEKIGIRVNIDQVNSHRTINATFEQNPGLHLIKYYY